MIFFLGVCKNTWKVKYFCIPATTFTKMSKKSNPNMIQFIIESLLLSTV